MLLTDNNRGNYKLTRQFSDNTLPESIQIVNSLLNDTFVEATFQQDCKQGMDIVGTSGTTVSVRIRNKKYLRYYGEITFRSAVVYGGETELSKMRKGIHADYMFYGYDCGGIVGWCLIDLRILVPLMFENTNHLIRKTNPDGTKFITVPWFEDEAFHSSVVKWWKNGVTKDGFN